MPWSSQGGGGGPWGGGGGQGPSPWGRGPSGGGQPPPNIEDLIRRTQDQLRSLLPGGFRSFRSIALLVIAALVVWLATGIYRVEPDEQGVELVFGKWRETTPAGLQWNWPAPIGGVLKPKVTRVNREEIGFRSGATTTSRGELLRDVPEESLMLTGDENIIDIQFAVFWVINDAGKFLFNIRNPAQTVKDAAEAAMREIVGKTGFEFARTRGRGEVQADTLVLLQSMLDDYGAGITVTQLQLQRVDPPGQVIEAFRDVQAARADKERAVNEAQAYLNEVTSRAQGEAEQIVKDAEAYREEKIAQANGDSQRFLAVYEQYKQARDVTTRRMYLETMEDILGGMDKVLIDTSQGGSGVVPYLPLNELRAREPARGGGDGQ
jgi:membrane protease subunit HflK